MFVTAAAAAYFDMRHLIIGPGDDALAYRSPRGMQVRVHTTA